MKLFRRLIIPDSHFPWVCKKAWSVVLDVAQDFKPHEIVILGDFFDCYNVSRFDKDPRRAVRLLEEELVEGRKALLRLRAIQRNMVFLSGNHEHRITKYINAYAGLFHDKITIQSVLNLPGGCRFFPYGQGNNYKMGKLLATHGSLTGKYPAAKMLERFKTNVVFGHTHVLQEHRSTNAHGEQFTATSLGWLGDLKKAGDYMLTQPDWTHAFGVSYFDAVGNYHLQPIEIKNGQALFNGKIY